MISKAKSSYYKRRMGKLFTEKPEAKFVRERYKVIRYTLLEKYPWIESLPKAEMLTFLRETIYLDRLLRLRTEKVEQTTKKALSQQFVLEELNYEVGQNKLTFK